MVDDMAVICPTVLFPKGMDSGAHHFHEFILKSVARVCLIAEYVYGAHFTHKNIYLKLVDIFECDRCPPSSNEPIIERDQQRMGASLFRTFHFIENQCEEHWAMAVQPIMKPTAHFQTAQNLMLNFVKLQSTAR